jgi:outer membrane murein-binding lipoprotein Lpp
VVDTLLWLLKRFLSTGTTGDEGCDRALSPIFVVGVISNFTHETLAEQVEELTAEIAQLPLTAIQERKARALQKRLECARLKKMVDPG